MPVYLNESHMGGLWLSTIEEEHPYCEECGDSDTTLGEVTSERHLRSMIKDRSYTKKYSDEIVEDYRSLTERNPIL